MPSKHRLTFHPLDNADSLLIELANGRLLIVDYAHMKTDDKPKIWDLKAKLTARLKELGRTDVDVFCPTHLDRDHLHLAHEFFYLEHAATYQDGERFKIKVLWVPAGAITEEGCEDDARVWRAEARHRLKAGKNIRVFGRPDRLKKWMEENGVDYESRKHLITDAGNLIPGFTLAEDEVEFFLHSPHGHRINERDIEDRNQDCVVTQAVFSSAGSQTKVILAGDAPWECLQDIVNITKYHGREHRLDYNVFKLPHHSSYLSLSDDKGTTQTVPKDEVKEWYDRGGKYCLLVSSSEVIGTTDQKMPPHFQAANYYRSVTSAKQGQFKVTMEHPNAFDPKPLVIEIDNFGATLKGVAAAVGVSQAVTSTPPKAG